MAHGAQALRAGQPPAQPVPTLYQFKECHECGLVRRLLRQADLPFDVVTLPVGDKSIVRQKFKSESVPVYVDGDWVSNDLGAICDRITKAH